jgi:hypothetical protein
MMKISLHTAQKLLEDADDMWVENQPTDWLSTSIGTPPEDTFFESEFEDEEGLVFEYKAYGEDNIAARLVGSTLTLVGREEDGDLLEFDVTLLKKWDAEAYLGRDRG